MIDCNTTVPFKKYLLFDSTTLPPLLFIKDHVYIINHYVD